MHKIWATFFFLSDNMRYNIKNEYNIYDLIADMGGFLEIFFYSCYYLPFWFNTFALENKSIRLLYMEKGNHLNSV